MNAFSYFLTILRRPEIRRLTETVQLISWFEARYNVRSWAVLSLSDGQAPGSQYYLDDGRVGLKAMRRCLIETEAARSQNHHRITRRSYYLTVRAST